MKDELPSDELIAAERPAFEVWCKSEGIDTALWIKDQPKCGYTNARTTDYWTGWIARALLAEQARTEPKAFTDDELRAEVKLRIERSGQTQEGYAKAHGYSPQYLSDFLTGKRLPGDKILQGEGLQAQTLYLDSMAVRVGVTGHNRFATRGDAGNLACKKCGARGLFTQIHQRPDGSDCGYLAHIVFAAQPLKAEQAKDAAEDAELLDWLDTTNKRFKMGWKVGVAPAGNCSVQSVIFLGNSEPVTIRAAIRAARAAERKA